MDADDIECPNCGGEMVLRRNATKRQDFWGCKEYPRCDGTRPLDSAPAGALGEEPRHQRQDGFSRRRWEGS